MLIQLGVSRMKALSILEYGPLKINKGMIILRDNSIGDPNNG